MKLAFGIAFGDLYERAGLLRVDAAFLDFVGEADPGLRQRLIQARQAPPAAKEESELLVALAPHVEDFLARLFGIEAEARALAERHHELAPIYSVKRLFVQRRAVHKVKAEEAAAVDGDAGEKQLADLFEEPFSELAFAWHVTEWQKDEAAHAAKLELAARYAAWATTTPAGKKKHRAGVLFKVPSKLDFMRLVPVHTEETKGFPQHTLSDEHLRLREGFGLTDPGTDLNGALDQANY